MRRTGHVELMRTLDERFIATPAAFATMRITGAMVVDGALLRDASGVLDESLVRALVGRAARRFAPMRQRLRPMPLGVTTPAWVNADVDLAHHVRVAAPGSLDELHLLSGDANGPLDPARPLWGAVAMPLPTGDVAVVPQSHHALGDGIFALRVLDAMTEDEPFDPSSDPVPLDPPSPRTAVGILLRAFRDWRAQRANAGAAWREYWRKPFVRRLCRMGGRILRPIRNRGARGRPLPPRHHAFARVDLSSVRAAARAAGCGVHDLTVVAALLALDAALPPGAPAAIAVPVSRRVGLTGEERNHIVMIRIEIPRGSTRESAIDRVRTAVAVAVAGESGGLPAHRDWPGYASFLPWRPRRRYLGPAAVRSVVFWPVLDPFDAIGFFGSSYGETYTLAVSTAGDYDPVVAVQRSLDAMGVAAREIHGGER
jgi:hypothetical protein